MVTSGSPQSVRDDAERIVEITTFTENGLQELQEPLPSQDEGGISVKRKEERCDVENPYTPFASSIKGKLDLLPTFSGEHCCIYKVPEWLRQINIAAFTPQVVSIGPLHHGKENLQAMEAHKKKYLKEFLERTNVRMEKLIETVTKNEEKLRDCYAEIIQMDSKAFVEMILVDATFIIELLLKDKESSHRKFINDRIFNKPWMLHDVMVDMFVLENQIPYFILEKLYDAAEITLPCHDAAEITLQNQNSKEDEVGNGKGKLFIIALFYYLVEGFLPPSHSLGQLVNPEFLHFLDFFRNAFQPAEISRRVMAKSFNKWTMTELQQRGVKFQALDLTRNNMFDIKFQDGILHIPKITCKGGMEVLLRNLIAFEQCHCDTRFLTDYATFLDSLINTEKDTEILIRHEVLEDWSSDNTKSTNLFSSLSDYCSYEERNFLFAGVWEDLDDYCKERWNWWKAIFRRNYLNTPWAIISLLAAAAFLILTLLQTIWSMTHP